MGHRPEQVNNTPVDMSRPIRVIPGSRSSRPAITATSKPTALNNQPVCATRSAHRDHHQHETTPRPRHHSQPAGHTSKQTPGDIIVAPRTRPIPPPIHRGRIRALRPVWIPARMRALIPLLSWALAGWLLVVAVTTPCWAQNNREYEVKAAFLYNFAKFITWPEAESKESSRRSRPCRDLSQDNDKAFYITVVGDHPFGTSLDAMEGKKVHEKTVRVRYLDRFDPEQSPPILRSAHMVFLCRSERHRINRILAVINGYPVVTVSELDDFLEAGGIINFLLVDGKVRFEINLREAHHAGLQISSKLLRLAHRVIQ